MLRTDFVEYNDDGTLLEGFCAYEDNGESKRPAILIVHDWSGRGEFPDNKAKQLAELGYVGFALDMFGKGKRGNTKEEKQALIQPFVADRSKIKKRMLCALDTVKKLPQVDSSRIAVMGYCFGGLCALDLARSGADIKGAISFHGLLQAPTNEARHKILAKILVLHGFDDPMVTPDQVMRFGEEMTHAGVDWQIVIYGHAKHAFTNPVANDDAAGIIYNPKADARSWIAATEFFTEIL